MTDSCEGYFLHWHAVITIAAPDLQSGASGESLMLAAYEVTSRRGELCAASQGKHASPSPSS